MLLFKESVNSHSPCFHTWFPSQQHGGSEFDGAAAGLGAAVDGTSLPAKSRRTAKGRSGEPGAARKTKSRGRDSLDSANGDAGGAPSSAAKRQKSRKSLDSLAAASAAAAAFAAEEEAAAAAAAAATAKAAAAAKAEAEAAAAAAAAAEMELPPTLSHSELTEACPWTSLAGWSRRKAAAFILAQETAAEASQGAGTNNNNKARAASVSSTAAAASAAKTKAEKTELCGSLLRVLRGCQQLAASAPITWPGCGDLTAVLTTEGGFVLHAAGQPGEPFSFPSSKHIAQIAGSPPPNADADADDNDTDSDDDTTSSSSSGPSKWAAVCIAGVPLSEWERRLRKLARPSDSDGDRAGFSILTSRPVNVEVKIKTTIL